MKAPDILEEAIATLAARGKERDQEGERSMARAAEIYNAIDGSAIDERSGWTFMIALKLARAERSNNPDHYIDLCGYIALLGEHVLEQQKQFEERREALNGNDHETVNKTSWDHLEVNNESLREYRPVHKCENCGTTFIVSPSIQHCPSCSAHVTYMPL